MKLVSRSTSSWRDWKMPRRTTLRQDAEPDFDLVQPAGVRGSEC